MKTKTTHQSNTTPQKSAETCQISLFSVVQPPVRGNTSSKTGKVTIDEKVLRAELQELAGDLKVAVATKPVGRAVGIRQTDTKFEVNFNPKLIKTQKQLDDHITFARDFIGGGIGA